MTRTEITDAFVPLLRELWPRWEPTPEQVAQVDRICGGLSLEIARTSARRHADDVAGQRYATRPDLRAIRGLGQKCYTQQAGYSLLDRMIAEWQTYYRDWGETPPPEAELRQLLAAGRSPRRPRRAQEALTRLRESIRERGR